MTLDLTKGSVTETEERTQVKKKMGLKLFYPKGEVIIDLYEAYIPIFGLLLCLEPFYKFLVGGWVVVVVAGGGLRVSLVFTFGQKPQLKFGPS